MLNYVWLGLILIAIIMGAATGNIEAVTKQAFDSAETAVKIALGLISVMTLWLGLMKVAEAAGLVNLLSRALAPIMKRLFPQVPQDHPAMGSIVLNLAANWLGLSNAATPFGLKAMEELQQLNPKKDTATNAMVMFLGMNTSCITLIPATIIGVRVSLGSSNPFEIIGTTIIASSVATTVAIVMARLLGRLAIFRKDDPFASVEAENASSPSRQEA
ncbi:MAG: nucleoside recognition domain-containing protein [bacterium]